MLYNLAEIFHSLKGEGQWTGEPMAFIRLSDCNVNCPYCDTDITEKLLLDEKEICERVTAFPVSRVVVTGGEPLMQDTSDLVRFLMRRGYKVHLETNGTLPLQHDMWSWICVSPKGFDIDRRTVMMAQELKFLVGIEGWQELIEHVVPMNRFMARKYVMPLAKAFPYRGIDGMIEDNVREAINFCMQRPDFSLCIQMHKVLGIN